MTLHRRLLTLVALLALCPAILPLAYLSAAGTGEPVLVRLPAGAYSSGSLPAGRVLDYGSFFWLEIAAADLARLQASGLPLEVHADPFTLRLGEESFDPLQGEPRLPAGWEEVSGDGPDLHLVQFWGPTQAGWLQQLRRQGLEIVQYIHPFTYVVWGEPGALGRSATATSVRWAGPFAPAYRVLPQWRDLPDRPVDVDVLLYRGADTTAALRYIEVLGGQSLGRAVLNDVFEIAGFSISGAVLQAAARVPGVYSIQLRPTGGGLRGEMSNQVTVNNVDGMNLAFPGYPTWLSGVGLDGSGVIIANVDSGVQETHPDLINRFLACTGQTCGGILYSEHGTHTAGIMAADGSTGILDGYGFLRGLGMAPGANLVEQVYSPWDQQAGGMLLLMTDSYNNGASLSGNSWGPAVTPQGYDNDTMQVDIGVRDADPNTPGNQPLIYVLSIMNGYGGYQTQGSPDEAKNIFTVGSTKMQKSDGSQILAIDDLSINTAHGPALDLRNIPHLVAPGCYVDSTVPGGHSVATWCGTSMSSPHVSGSVALFIEFYRSLSGGLDPSAALVKAAFLPVAHDLAGHRDADGNTLGHPFDSKQGWGRLDAEAVLDPQVPVRYFDTPVVFDNTGEQWAQSLAAANPAQPLRLMLVWTDAPGHGLGGSTPAWNNDLDLVVDVGDSSYKGNDFGTDGWSQAGGEPDHMNNTEGVFLSPGTAQNFTVRVVASNINSDGIPNEGDATDQDFALVCYNCLDEADFVLSAQPNAFNLCAPASAAGTIQVGQVLDYAQPVTLEVSGAPPGVSANVVPALVTPPGEATLSLEVADRVAAGAYSLVVSGTAEVDRIHSAGVTLKLSTAPLGAPGLLSPPDGTLGLAPYDLLLAWEPSPQAQSYSLQLDTDPNFSTPLLDVGDIPTAAYTLAGPLEYDTCYFWRAGSENACGPGRWAPPARFATARVDPILVNDVEAGEGDWTASGLWHITTKQADPCAQAHSGIRSWYYGREPECDYDAGINSGSLTLDTPLDLSGVLTPVKLRFWSWEQAENYGEVDTRKVFLSSDGTTWTQAWRSAENSLDWRQIELDVSSYAGGNLYIRFKFDTVDSFLNDNRGWYVDDIEVVAALPPLSDPPVLLGIAPQTDIPGSQTPVTISGQSFWPAPVVLLGGTPLLDVTYVSSTTLTAMVPAGLPAGPHDLIVVNGDCQGAMLPDAFAVAGQIHLYLPLVFR